MAKRFCEICSKEILAERLEILPETRLCTEHAHQIAQHGGEYRTSVRQENIGKAGSLKKNYGGIETVRVRNTKAVEKIRDEHERLQEEKE